MKCVQFEERMSDYLENALPAADRCAMEMHFETCKVCWELLDSMKSVLDWAKDFPVFEPPVWLPTRILANTPRVVHETWLDTLAAAGRWFIEPRTAMGLLTAVLMIGWLGSGTGVSSIGDVVSAVRNPAATCYAVYDGAVRTFYRAPLVTQIRSEIERLREIS